MNALIFPGQGSQIVGMGKEFFNNFSFVKKIFQEADDKLKTNISKIILDGPADKLQLTENTQPAILVVSYSIFETIKNEFNFGINNFKYFAGHSLGEYSALVCSNALEFQDALFLLYQRGKAMQSAVPVGRGSMLAVLGSKIENIENEIKNLKLDNDVCEIANDNADGQVIVSGDKKGVDLLKSNLQQKKIKSIPLKVSAPFHCSLMRPAAEKMKDKILSTKFNEPALEIVCNVTAKPEKNAETIKKLLIEQIYSSVKWRESMIHVNESGVSNFIEIGPGKVLSGMIKRTIKDSNCFSINSIADIKKLLDELKK
ncbi:MAG: ACP S-malonyltransferase [Pseudomonadota bacterium]|nr:ACP S-malonyltransferase [Pseudomonadota bacterium]